MADSFRPPKLEKLLENITISDYSAWQSNVLYHLSISRDYAPYLEAEWSKQGVANRGLLDDADTVEATVRKTAVQKKIILERMLALIAQFSPPLLRNEIIKRSTSLSWIWQRIRKHYNFAQSESNFLSLADIERKPDERYETFYQRINAHVEDNLLTIGCMLEHDGETVTEDEIISPTTERLVVYLWLYLIDRRLPKYVARIYAEKLQRMTLKDIQPLLSQSMSELLADLNAHEDISVQYTRSFGKKGAGQQNYPKFGERATSFKQNDTRTSNTHSTSTNKYCIVCKQAKRTSDGHDVSNCYYLSPHEKAQLMKSLRIVDVDPSENTDGDTVSADVDIVDVHTEELNVEESAEVRRVDSAISPFFYAFYGHHTCKIVLDTGATSSVISKAFLDRIGMEPESTNHSARGVSKKDLDLKGEQHLTVTFGNKSLQVSGVVLDSLDCDILAGTPFGKKNKVDVFMSSETICIQGQTIPYGAKAKCHDVYRVECLLLRNDDEKVLMPGEFVEIQSEELRNFDGEVAVEAHVSSPLSGNWPEPAITRVIQGTVRIPNAGQEPVQISKTQHIAQIHRVIVPPLDTTTIQSVSQVREIPIVPSEPSPKTFYSDAINMDEDMLSRHERNLFQEVNRTFDTQFTPKFGAYNDKSGCIRAALHLGPVQPPQIKGKLPFYGTQSMQQLQNEADKLEELGVLRKPEELGVQIKYASPSFLRLKPDGTFRFVTAFNNLSQYTRILPTASLPPDEILRRVSSFEHVIKTDFKKAYYQVKVAKSSMPYLATATPYKGLRVYARSAMGMPGCAEFLDELTSRVLGDFVHEGWLALIHDDLLVCSNDIRDLLSRWTLLLQRFER